MQLRGLKAQLRGLKVKRSPFELDSSSKKVQLPSSKLDSSRTYAQVTENRTAEDAEDTEK
ncbi:MAG: hypothetical protein RM021_026940 [Nostoc sp. EkiNYC01]|nr:hypothetical protein [Nostoc sp. EkiNYC01]